MMSKHVQARNLHLSGISHEFPYDFPIFRGDFPQSPRQFVRPDLLNAFLLRPGPLFRGRWRSSWTSSSQSFGFPTTQGPATGSGMGHQSSPWIYRCYSRKTIPPEMGAVHDCFTHMKGNTPMYIH